MLPSDIVLGTNTYSLITQRANSTVRGDASQDLDKPVTMTVAHENSKSGRRSTVVIFSSSEVISCNDTCDITPVTDDIRVHLKLQYNPLSGRTGIEDEIRRLITELVRVEADTDLMARLLNGES